MFPYRLIRIVDHRAILDKPPNKVNVQARGFFRGTIEKKTSRESQIVEEEKERKEEISGGNDGFSKDEKFCGRHTHARTRLSTRLNRNTRRVLTLTGKKIR